MSSNIITTQNNPQEEEDLGKIEEESKNRRCDIEIEQIIESYQDMLKILSVSFN